MNLFHRIGLAIVIAIAAAPAAGQQLYAYPKAGQPPDQQQRDRYECHTWAVQQSGYDPTQAQAQPASQQQQMQQQAGQGRPGGGAAGGAGKGAARAAVMDNDVGKGAAMGAAGGMLRKRMQEKKQESAQQAMLFVDRRNRRADLVWAKALRILPQETYTQACSIHAPIKVKTSLQVRRSAKTLKLLTLKSRQDSRRALFLA